jgi:CelD/BcsL family acetyltransferase involved in cellulose biosynthesis
MISVTELTSFDELASLRVTWGQLWEETREASFVQTWEWFRSYWRVFGTGKKIRTLIVSMGSKPIGIVPFIVSPVRTRFGWANVVTWPLDQWGPFYGPVGINPAAALSGALQYLNDCNDWHAVELPYIDEQGNDRGRTRSAFKASKMQGRQTATTSHPAVAFDSSWDWFMQEQSGSCRAQFGKSQQNLEKFGPVSFFRWRPAGIKAGDTNRRWDLFAQFEMAKLANASSSSKAEIDLTFLRDLHPAAVDAGAVEICTLTIRGRTVACAYANHSHGNVDLLFAGAAKEVGDDATNVLIGQMIRDSFMRNDRRIVFQADQSRFAVLWSNSSVEAVTYGHYNLLSPQAQLLKMKRAKKDSQAGKYVIPKLNDGAGVKQVKV